MKIQMRWAKTRTNTFPAAAKSRLQDKHFKKRLWHAYAVWRELKRNLRIQIDKYLERIASGAEKWEKRVKVARPGKKGENGGEAAATMTLNEPVYGVRVAKVKQEIKARISTLKRRRRRQGWGGMSKRKGEVLPTGSGDESCNVK